MSQLEIVPVSFRTANAFILAYHRHHEPPRGYKLTAGVALAGQLVGVATAGRPVARAFDTGWMLEVNRTCTDGTRNVNSMLYSAIWRAGRALGYRGAITYTQDGETGASLKAAGWMRVAERAARPNWAESSVTLKHLRDTDGPGGVLRFLWEAPGTRWDAPPLPVFRRASPDDAGPGLFPVEAAS